MTNVHRLTPSDWEQVRSRFMSSNPRQIGTGERTDAQSRVRTEADSLTRNQNKAAACIPLRSIPAETSN